VKWEYGWVYSEVLGDKKGKKMWIKKGGKDKPKWKFFHRTKLVDGRTKGCPKKKKKKRKRGGKNQLIKERKDSRNRGIFHTFLGRGSTWERGGGGM